MSPMLLCIHVIIRKECNLTIYSYLYISARIAKLKDLLGMLNPDNSKGAVNLQDRGNTYADQVMNALPDLIRVCGKDGRGQHPVKLHQDLIANPDTAEILSLIIKHASNLEQNTARYCFISLRAY